MTRTRPLVQNINRVGAASAFKQPIFRLAPPVRMVLWAILSPCSHNMNPETLPEYGALCWCASEHAHEIEHGLQYLGASYRSVIRGSKPYHYFHSVSSVYSRRIKEGYRAGRPASSITKTPGRGRKSCFGKFFGYSHSKVGETYSCNMI
jgi:hypothetical protein